MAGSITISFGTNNMVTRDAALYPCPASIVQDQALRQFLGFGAQVDVLVNGRADLATIQAGDDVEVRNRANEKG